MIKSWNRLAGIIAGATAPMLMLATEALARHPSHQGHAPEIDGPAGVAAISLLVGVGMIAYRRFKK